MNNKRLIIGTIVIVSIILSVVFIANAQDNQSTQDVSEIAGFQIDGIAQAEEVAIQQTVSAAGILDPERRVTLSFQSSAPVTQIFVEEGQRVQAGDVLATVDSRSFDERVQATALQLAIEELNYDTLINPATPEDIAAAEADVRAAELAMGVGIALTGADSIAAEIDAVNAELQANQLWQQQLNRDNNPPNLDGAWVAVLRAEGTDNYDAALEDFQLAEAQAILNANNLQVMESNVVVAQENALAESQRPTSTGGSSTAQQQLTQAQITLNNLIGDPDDVTLSQAEIDLLLAQLDLRYVEILAEQAQIIAPFDGIVATVNLAEGQVPSPNAITLVDNSQYTVTIPVDEIDVVNVAIGQTVSLSFDALPDVTVTGVVDDVAFVPTRIGDIVTYDVRIVLDETDTPIRTGMTAIAEINILNLDNVLVIPSEFILESQQFNAEVVIVQQADGTLLPRRVTTGIEDGGRTEIVSGLDAGDTIVLMPQSEILRLVREQVQSGNFNTDGGN